MSFLIFCSFEVGGLPFRMAEVLNRHGVETYYISLQKKSADHDSTRFHYGDTSASWDISHLVSDCLASRRKMMARLRQIRDDYAVSSCLATGNRAYLLEGAGIRYNYWSFGSDLDQQCFSPVWPAGYPPWKKMVIFPFFAVTVRTPQRASIRKAEAIMIAPYQQAALRQVSPGKRVFFLPHFLKAIEYGDLLKAKKGSRAAVCREIGARNYFFSASRHVWAGQNRNISDNKGNDVMLRAFAEYLDLTGDEVKLVLVKKGVDVDASVSLIRDLKLDRHIVWVDEMPRDDLDRYYQGASLCFGQFGTPVISFSVLEPLANATACISHFDWPDPSFPFYRDVPPVINSKDPAEIRKRIATLMTDREYCDALSYQSWQWARENCSEERFVEGFLGCLA